MKTVDQIARGVTGFYDMEMRKNLDGWKAIAYGVALGRIAANMPRLVEQYASILAPVGVLVDGKVDVEGLAAELRSQMEKGEGKLVIPIFNDVFTFTPGDVDTLLRYIERS